MSDLFTGLIPSLPLLRSEMVLSQALRVSILAPVTASSAHPASDDCLLQVQNVAQSAVDKSGDIPSCVVQHCTNPADPCPANAAYLACLDTVLADNDGLPEHDVAINQATLVPPGFTPAWSTSTSLLQEEDADQSPGTGAALLEGEKVEQGEQVVGVRILTSGHRWANSSGKVQVDFRCADGMWHGTSANSAGPFSASRTYTMRQTLPAGCGWPSMLRLTLSNTNGVGFKRIEMFEGSDFSASDKKVTIIESEDGAEYGTNPFWLDGDGWAGNGKLYLVPHADLPWKAYDLDGWDSAEAALLTSKISKKRRLRLDGDQKVFIENQAILGDGAGDGALGMCRPLSPQHFSNPSAPTVRVCGTGVKATFFLRARCAGYYQHARQLGRCDRGLPPNICHTFSPAQDSRFGHYQSYLIEECYSR